MPETILKLIFFGATVCQLLFWFFVFSRLAFYKIDKKNNVLESTPSCRALLAVTILPPISIIICARNEAENLSKNLPSILNQEYDSFEVIVVNDASTDETSEVLNGFVLRYEHLRIINIADKKILGKKGALAAGIEAAKHEWLLLTDADCYPSGSKNWILGMIKGVDAKEIGLGYAPYEKRDGFLNTFIRYETVWTAIQYMGFALAGEPYMGVGRNMIYMKKLYEKVGGFQKHAHIASGDDDLFINSVISRKNFSIILNPETFMLSEPQTRWNAYFTQKKRHFSTATSYTLKHKMMLGTLSASHFFYFVTAVSLLALKISTIFVLLGLVVRTLVMWFFYGKILRRFHEHNLILWIPLLDVVYVFFYLFFLPALMIKTRKWR